MILSTVILIEVLMTVKFDLISTASIRKSLMMFRVLMHCFSFLQWIRLQFTGATKRGHHEKRLVITIIMKQQLVEIKLG